jgi:hypothetical protein
LEVRAVHQLRHTRLAGLAVVLVLVLAGAAAAGPTKQGTSVPDPPDLAFVDSRDGDAEISTIRADGSGLRKLTSNRFGDYAPAWRRTASASPSRATGTGTRRSTSWTPTAVG